MNKLLLKTCVIHPGEARPLIRPTGTFSQAVIPACHPTFSAGAGIQYKNKKGFTLIELLVVILIISIVTGVALLSITRSGSKEAENFSKVMVEWISLAQEQALLESETLGLSIHANTISFYRLDKTAKKTSWVELQDGLLRPKSIPENVEVQVVTDNGEREEKKSDTPDITISPNGDLNAFTLQIGPKNRSPLYTIKGREDGFIERIELDN